MPYSNWFIGCPFIEFVGNRKDLQCVSPQDMTFIKYPRSKRKLLNVTHFRSSFLSISPENIRNSEAFLCFLRVYDNGRDNEEYALVKIHIFYKSNFIRTKALIQAKNIRRS